MEDRARFLKSRLWVLAVIAAIGAFLLYGVATNASWLPICMLFEKTGIYCPG